MRHLPTRWKAAAAIAVTAAFFTPLLVLGGPAFARTGAAASEYEYAGSSQYQYRIVICHLTRSKKHPAHTITISSAAWPAHQRHGDHLGPCTGDEQPRPKANHGHHNDASTHGNSGVHHGHGHGSHGKP